MSFPLHVLPDPIHAYIVEGAAALGCEASYIAVPMLPVLASAIGNTRRIRLKKGWNEPAVIWAASVGESGTAKSPAHDLAVRPVWRRQRKILKAYGEARAQHEAEVREWKALPKKERGEEPEAPAPCEHCICVDITIEATADRLLATPRGVLMGPEELSAWFGSFNQYKSGGADVAHWLALHGARALKVDRKTGDRPTIYIPHAAVSISGTIQPGTLRRALLPEFFDNGLAARLLVTMPETRAKKWTDAEISDETMRAVDDLFDALYALRPDDGIDGPEPKMIGLADDAQQRWIGFVNEFNEQMQALEGNERAAGAKLEAYAARFALIFHCIRQAAGEIESDYIGADDIEAGITLARWFGLETARVYGAMSESGEQRHRRELRQWIAERGGRVTVRDLQRGPRRFRENPDAAEAELAKLVSEGLGNSSTIPTGERGRPMTVFYLADSPDFPIHKGGDGDTNGKTTGKFAISSPSPRSRGKID
ncbi:MAG TPA: YfjI family protein [Tepidisphaeraceae bacterium]